VSEEGGEAAPAGWHPLPARSAFARLVGPFYGPQEAGPPFRRALLVAERHANRRGIAHGGMLSAFADMLLGETIARSQAGAAVTVRLVSDFVAPARLGEWLEGEARIVRVADGLVHAEGLLHVGRRSVLRTSAVFARIRPGRLAARDDDATGRDA